MSMLYELVANSLVFPLQKKLLSKKGNPSSSLLTTLPHWMLGFFFWRFSPIFSYTSTHFHEHGLCLFTQVINWVKHVCKTKPNLKPNQASIISRSLQNRSFYKSKNPFSKWHSRFCCYNNNNNNKIRLDFIFYSKKTHKKKHWDPNFPFKINNLTSLKGPQRTLNPQEPKLDRQSELAYWLDC